MQSNFTCCERLTESDRKVRDTVCVLCLFQSHSRETLTKSISLPRSAYWQHITRQTSVGDLYSYQGTNKKSLIVICTGWVFWLAGKTEKLLMRITQQLWL